MHIKDLELTEKDFEMLVEGLDALPDKGAAGEMLGDLMAGLFAKDEDQQKKILADHDKRAASKKAVKQQQLEDIRILQGKLLMFKRWLIQEGALKQANDILDELEE